VKTTYLYQTALSQEMGLSKYDRILILKKISKTNKSHKAKRVLMNFPQKRCKTILDIFNVLMKAKTDQDENGVAERQEQLIQQRMSAMLTILYSARKELPCTKQRN